MVIDQNGTVEETNHYYPFGGVFASTSSIQPYKYNGKELDTKKGLNWYDYGARHYDAALGRFATVDPSSESYYETSPYAYCGNNPVVYYDPSGYYTALGNLFTDSVIETKGNSTDLKIAILKMITGDADISDATVGSHQA